MAKCVGVQSSRSGAYLQVHGRDGTIDYRGMYFELRSNSSTSGVSTSTMKEKAKNLKETAERLERI